MRNRYEGICYFCNTKVEKQDGHFERYKGGWRTIHANCVFITRALREFERTPNPTVTREYFIFSSLLTSYKNRDKDFVAADMQLLCLPRNDKKIYIVGFKRRKGGIHTFHSKVMPDVYYKDINMIKRIIKYFSKVDLSV